jgi:hypothetical protein
MKSYSGGGGGTLQLYTPYSPNYGGTPLRFRTGIYETNTFTAWKIMLDETNYNSYAVDYRIQSNWSSSTVINNVVGMLAWKNYGNNHVIFDASASTTPSGGGCNSTNSTAAWVATYPTLMGWNGSTTYGVRVDSARVSDTSNALSGYAYTNFLGKNGNSYYQVDTWLQLNGAHGIYCPGTNGAHWYPNTTSTYTTWTMAGSRGSYGGFYDSYSLVNPAMYDSGGNGGTYREPSGRWYTYYNVSNNCLGINDSYTDSGYSLHVGGGKGIKSLTGYNYFGGAVYSATYLASGTDVYTNANYGYGLVGLYSPYRIQGIFTMGDAYRLPADGTHSGNLYGLAWSYPAAGGQAANLSSHGLLVMINGTTYCALSSNIWCYGTITAAGGGFDSDLTLKDIITRDLSKHQIANKISAFKYKWKDQSKSQTERFGYGAQELLEIIPEAVYKSGGTLAVDYTQVHTVLIDENTKRINELEKEIKQLKDELGKFSK